MDIDTYIQPTHLDMLRPDQIYPKPESGQPRWNTERVIIPENMEEFPHAVLMEFLVRGGSTALMRILAEFMQMQYSLFQPEKDQNRYPHLATAYMLPSLGENYMAIKDTYGPGPLEMTDTFGSIRAAAVDKYGVYHADPLLREKLHFVIGMRHPYHVFASQTINKKDTNANPHVFARIQDIMFRRYKEREAGGYNAVPFAYDILGEEDPLTIINELGSQLGLNVPLESLRFTQDGNNKIEWLEAARNQKYYETYIKPTLTQGEFAYSPSEYVEGLSNRDIEILKPAAYQYEEFLELSRNTLRPHA